VIQGGEDEEELWWRPPWETDETSELSGRRQPPEEPDDAHPLLAPLARAQDAVARLEAAAGAASPVVAEGLRGRLAYQEAAGWLRCAHVWVHPNDLALRDNGMTGSYGVAAQAGRLGAEMPSTVGRGFDVDIVSTDIAVAQALRLARLWRRLGEFRTWAPLANAGAVRKTLEYLGCSGAMADADIEDWLAVIHLREQGPPLIRAGRAARNWMNRSQVTDPTSPDGFFLAACLWRQSGHGRPVALPFWSAPEQRHHRLGLRVGRAWMASFLDCVADAARAGRDELGRLQEAEGKGRHLARTARSKLPAALNAALRSPVITARGLASNLDITPQAALGLLGQLREAGIIREATGRASWRAFVTV
jgi:hypothetical protein